MNLTKEKYRLSICVCPVELILKIEESSLTKTFTPLSSLWTPIINIIIGLTLPQNQYIRINS